MKRTLPLLGVIAGLSMSASAVAAGLEGSQVTITGYCCVAPIEQYRQTIPLTKTVDSSVEFPDGSITNIGNLTIFGSSVDVSSNAIDIVYTRAGRTGAGGFNGFVFDFQGIDLPIQGVSLNAASTLSAADVDLGFDSNSVLYSVPGVNLAVGSRVVIDVSLGAVPIPEPSTYALFLAGIGLVGVAVSRRRYRDSEES